MLALALLIGCGAEQEPAPIEIRIAQPALNSLDPAYAHAGDAGSLAAASETMPLLYTPLLAYRHRPGKSGAELIPGLAHDLPEVSDDLTTYRLQLRERLEYPNGAPVRASDFEHAVKRVLRSGSGAARFVAPIVGATEYRTKDDPRAPIRGIRTDDQSGELTIRLSRPDATFPHVLAMWSLGLVPVGTPIADQNDRPPVGVGPYELAERRQGGDYVLERSESFRSLDIPDIPTGSVDRIDVEASDRIKADAARVLEGGLDYLAATPPADVKASLLSQDGDRYREEPALGTYAFLFDLNRAPFDDPRVREAAAAALDRRPLAAAFGGELAPGCALLPPAVPGHDEDLNEEDCPSGEPGSAPDLERSRRLVERAGAAGSEVTVVGGDAPDVAEALRAYAESLSEIGLDARVRTLPDHVHRNRLERGHVPGEVSFALIEPDLPHPLSFYGQLGVGTHPYGGSGPLAEEAVVTAVDRLTAEPDVDRVADEWAELDRYVVSPPQALVAVIGHPTGATFVSERLDLDRIVFHPVYRNDYSTFALHADEEPR